jgi:hypothetical protein
MVLGQVSGDGVVTTSSKTVTINKGDEVFQRTVEVSTMENEDGALYNMKNGNNSENSKPLITKMVKIDNDRDAAFDEKIVFSYRAYTPEDFVLISEGNNMMVAVDDGQDLSIKQDMNLMTKDVSNAVETYVFTDENGKKIQFIVKEHIRQRNAASGSK